MHQHRRHRGISAVAFLVGLSLSAVCRAETDLVASYAGGIVTQQDVDRQRLFGDTNRQVRNRTTDVEAIVIRRTLAKGVESLPPAERSDCIDRKWIREAQLAEAELERRVLDRSRPSAASVRSYYDQNIARFQRPKQWRLRNVFLRVPDGASNQERLTTRDRLEFLLSKVENEAGFAELARTESDSPTAFRGGRIGYVSPAQLLPELGGVVKHLKPGEVSEIIETADGFTAMFCSGDRPARNFEFEEVQAEIANWLARTTFDSSWNELDRRIQRRVRPSVTAEAAEDGRDGATVLMVRTSGRSTRIRRSAYLHWASDRGRKDPYSWSRSEHDAALRALALVLGRADEARRLGLTHDEAFRARQIWEEEDTDAECVMDHEARTRIEVPTDAEIAAGYREIRDDLVEPETLDLEILRLELAPPDPPTQFRRLHGLADEVRQSGTDLDEVALDLQAEGFDVTIQTLGGVPISHVNSLGRNLADAVVSAEAGEVCGPLQEDRHLMLVRVVAVHPPRAPSIDEASPRIRRLLEGRKLEEARRTIAAEIIAGQAIEYR